MKKIALINQRYGLEVNGGSEYYTRLIAEHLKDAYQVEVLTTKAVDYMTWEDYYKNDLDEINGVTVRRFSVDHPRKQNSFDAINAKVLSRPDHSIEDEKKWAEEQGPYCPELVKYIKEHSNDYDVFIFVTYLYYLTSAALPEVADKSILIPTAHDEPFIYFKMFEKVFKSPKGILFLTDEEKEFVQKRFQNQDILCDTMAVGIEAPKNVSAEGFKSSRNVDNYIIYVGRIDEGKNCHILFKYFEEYKKRNQSNLKLVLMGKSVIPVPERPDILNLGFVSEEEKYNGISGAKALILPSAFESLSISVLESLNLNVPVIVNGDCEVLKGHCIKSNAGLYYHNYFEFEGCLNYLLSHEKEYEQMRDNAREYIDKYFQWNIIVEKFKNIIEKVAQ